MAMITSSPLKFFMISFFAATGLLFTSGERLNPLLGEDRAEKFGFLDCESIVVSSCESPEPFSFLLFCLSTFDADCFCGDSDDSPALSVSLMRRFQRLWLLFWFLVCCSCSGDLVTFERGMHTAVVATLGSRVSIKTINAGETNTTR